jgi:riboflavin biosynthesis pyrimidine reductase
VHDRGPWLTAGVRQVYPGGSALTDTALAGLYAYPDPGPPPGCWVRANMVASLDGAAAVDGRASGLSSEADEQVFAMLRALADVILVGAGTARAEGYGPVRPQSEVLRWAWLRDGRTPSAPIAVVTRALDLDPASPLLTGAPPHARTIVITTRAAPAERRTAAGRTAEVIVAGEASVDVKAALDALAERGYQRVLTEGGPLLLAQIAGAGLLDELCFTLSPLLAGPGAGRIVAGGLPVPGGAQPFTLKHALEAEGSLLCRYLRMSPRSKLTGSSSCA